MRAVDTRAAYRGCRECASTFNNIYNPCVLSPRDVEFFAQSYDNNNNGAYRVDELPYCRLCRVVAADNFSLSPVLLFSRLGRFGTNFLVQAYTMCNYALYPLYSVPYNLSCKNGRQRRLCASVNARGFKAPPFASLFLSCFLDLVVGREVARCTHGVENFLPPFARCTSLKKVFILCENGTRISRRTHTKNGPYNKFAIAFQHAFCDDFDESRIR